MRKNIEDYFNAISFSEIMRWKLRPTISWSKGNMIIEFTKKDTDKIYKKKPDWNGRIIFFNY